MKVLVTGATGFLGSWLVRRLLDEGCAVRITKRPSSQLEELEGLPLEIVSGDVTDRASIVAAARNVDSIFHLAGLIAYARSQRRAMEKINVDGTANVIAAAQENSVRKLVHLSSVVAVGASFDGTPLNEESPFNVEHLHLGYFDTKYEAEKLVIDAVKARRLDAVILNPSTIYGPGDAKKGSRSVQIKVAQGRFPFYPPGGVNVVSVEDVVDCIIAAWKKGRTGERYIVAGENLYIKDVFAMIAKEAGVEPPRIHLPKHALLAIGKFGDLMEKVGQKGPLTSENAWVSTLYHWFDSSKAQRELGLKSKPAHYAIAQSVGWMKQNGILK